MSGRAFLGVFWGLFFVFIAFDLWRFGFLLQVAGYLALAWGMGLIEPRSAQLHRARVLALALSWTPLLSMLRPTEGVWSIVCTALGFTILGLKIVLVWSFGLGLARAASTWGLPHVARRARLLGPAILMSMVMLHLGATVARTLGSEGRYGLVGLVFLPFGIIMIGGFVFIAAVLWQATLDEV